MVTKMFKLTPPSSISWTFFWHLAAAVFAIAAPSQLLFGNSLWRLADKEITFLGGIVLSYLMSALVLTLAVWKSKKVSIYAIWSALFAVFGCFFLWILATKAYYARPVLLLSLGLSLVFIVLPFLVRKKFLAGAFSFLVLVTVLSQLSGTTPKEVLDRALGFEPKPSRSVKVINTSFYNIKATRYSRYFEVCEDGPESCRFPRNGGGISTFGEGYLVANGEGSLDYFHLEGAREELKKTELTSRVPINSDAFIAAGHQTSGWLFRVMDVLVQDFGNRFRLFASHHYWKPEQQCFVVRVSTAENKYKTFLQGKTELEWRTVYETEPCLPLLAPHEYSHTERLFSGDESGGRLALVNDKDLLLTVGDHLFNGYDKEAMLAQDPSADYGKTILIDLDDGSSRVFTLGHRNPQGLYLDPKGNFWSVEHGPRGGDELNLLLDGQNYGWPLVTYGTDYGKLHWPLNEHQGNHLGYQRPFYSWVPSIATSNLIGVEKDLFGLWRGDLLVGAYTKQLSRVRIREGRVVYVEPIQIGRSNSRIRDLVEDNQGRIVLWLDGGSVLFLEPMGQKQSQQTGDSIAEYLDGETLFVQCSGCHAVQDGSNHGAGPDLFGVYERRIAVADNYSYSQALSAKTGSWDETNLDKYLENPALFAPGTTMQYPGIPDAGQRARIIEFLKSRQ